MVADVFGLASGDGIQGPDFVISGFQSGFWHGSFYVCF